MVALPPAGTGFGEIPACSQLPPLCVFVWIEILSAFAVLFVNVICWAPGDGCPACSSNSKLVWSKEKSSAPNPVTASRARTNKYFDSVHILELRCPKTIPYERNRRPTPESR